MGRMAICSIENCFLTKMKLIRSQKKKKPGGTSRIKIQKVIEPMAKELDFRKEKKRKEGVYRVTVGERRDVRESHSGLLCARLDAYFLKNYKPLSFKK